MTISLVYRKIVKILKTRRIYVTKSINKTINEWLRILGHALYLLTETGSNLRGITFKKEHVLSIQSKQLNCTKQEAIYAQRARTLSVKTISFMSLHQCPTEGRDDF